jgi:large subunit ribosomal protein L7/L12
MNVISIIQKLTGLDFNKSMRIAATPGGKVLEGVSKEVANDAKAKLEEAGAEVVLE